MLAILYHSPTTVQHQLLMLLFLLDCAACEHGTESGLLTANMWHSLLCLFCWSLNAKILATVPCSSTLPDCAVLLLLQYPPPSASRWNPKGCSSHQQGKESPSQAAGTSAGPSRHANSGSVEVPLGGIPALHSSSGHSAPAGMGKSHSC